MAQEAARQYEEERARLEEQRQLRAANLGARPWTRRR